MPELPEVEKARRQLELIAKGKRIADIQTWEDTIVFAGVTHDDFAAALRDKVVKDVRRKGKNFYLVLEGSDATPILHFGMSGFFAEKGQKGMHYSRPSVATTSGEEWPPKYVKLMMQFAEVGIGEGTGTGKVVGGGAEWAFADPRRLARIKLVAGVAEEVPPLSLLGADPLLNMPSVEVLREKLLKTTAPIKAVLLDQNKVFCGIGNWVADEVLYHARLHPSHPAALLTADDVARLHAQVRFVCQTAVDCDSDSHRFPKDWLFSSRWGKAKKATDFVLPDGRKTKITFMTVGGRTSAVIEEVQKLPAGLRQQAKRVSKPKPKGRATPKRKRVNSSEDEAEVEAEEKEDEDFDVNIKHETDGPISKSKRARVATAPVQEGDANSPIGDSGRRRSGRNK